MQLSLWPWTVGVQGRSAAAINVTRSSEEALATPRRPEDWRFQKAAKGASRGDGHTQEGTELGRTTESWVGWGCNQGTWSLGLRGQKEEPQSSNRFPLCFSPWVCLSKNVCACSVHMWTGAPCGVFGVAGSGGSPSVEPVYFSSVEWAQDPCRAEELEMQSQ